MERSVMLVVTSSAVAGAQRQVRDLALAVHRRGWRVSVVSMMSLSDSPDVDMYADLPANGVETHSLGMARGVPDPRAVLRLRKILRAFRPDVLHAHMVHAILLARVTRTVQPVPVLVSTMHNQHQGSRWRYRAYRLTDRLSDLTTTVSQMALDDTVRLGASPAGRIRVVPNGTDVAGFHRDAAARAAVRAELGLEATFAWLAVGRLDAAKDYPNMLDAVALLPADPPFRLLIAGAGPLEADIASRIDQLGLGDRVTLLGLRSDMPALMAAADGFVMSSAWEGLPMVLLEAGASGLPTVATDVGGSHDAILDGTSGQVVPTKDPQALAAAMLDVMALPEEERERMGAAGRAHIVGTFDLEAVADRWVSTYEELLAGSTGS